jgi:hypothetical protein
MNDEFIKFRYTVKPELAILMQQQISDYGADWIYGYLDRGLTGRLRHCSMYLVTELNDKYGVSVYSNPVAIVAPNDVQAMSYYREITNNDNGTILAEIVNRCDNITVEPA